MISRSNSVDLGHVEVQIKNTKKKFEILGTQVLNLRKIVRYFSESILMAVIMAWHTFLQSSFKIEDSNFHLNFINSE